MDIHSVKGLINKLKSDMPKLKEQISNSVKSTELFLKTTNIKKEDLPAYQAAMLASLSALTKAVIEDEVYISDEIKDFLDFMKQVENEIIDLFKKKGEGLL